MFYLIIVSLNGQHFFQTDKGSITTDKALKMVYETFKEKFPASEGYNILVWKSETVGKFLDMDEYLKGDE